MAAREWLWESGRDETVEVNQRALIDKVLARYSGEFTVFRELLQNSDDASAKAVEIHFETQAFLDRKKEGTNDQGSHGMADLKTELVHQWTFKNNGLIFRDEDWNRLKKIAEGNPDEEKIGAFGVGFYSLFSITEEPFVTSGDQWMGFYWKDKKDQLFARRGKLPDSVDTDARQWTSFEMPLREPAPIPVAFDLVRFLASSITFMVHVREISVFLDGKMLGRLSKDPGHPVTVPIPRGLKTISPLSLMYIKGISSTPLYIEAEVAHCVYTAGTSKPKVVAPAVINITKPTAVSSGFFSSLFSSLTNTPPTAATPARISTPLSLPPSVREIDPLKIRKSSVALRIFSVEADVRLDKKMIAELQRSTKKNPPNHVRLDLIYTGKSEYDASKQEDNKFDQRTGSVFQGLRADLEGTGSARVFIGHSTGQTTGIGGHIAARFIPTVERESIDLVDRNVSIWNKELLYVGGFLARAAYETELTKVRELWDASAEAGPDAIDDQLKAFFTSSCLHALKFFTFHPSTPSAIVSNLLEAAFFSCAIQHQFSIVSSAGVKNAADVRIPDPTFSAFLKQLPVLPKEISTEAKPMVEQLKTRGLVIDITFADVLGELRSRPLNETELLACMKWWIGVWKAGDSVHANLPQIRQQLLEATVLIVGTGTKDEKIIPLSQIRTFVNIRSVGSILPLDGPFPEYMLPIGVARSFPGSDLTSAFGWQELTIVDWTRYVSNPNTRSSDPEHDLCSSPFWAERVLNTLAKAWTSLAKSHQVEIVKILSDKPCIPTRAGLKLPEQAYFQNAHIFPDLPVVTMPKGTPVKGNMEKVLESLGVRKHVDLQVVFDRMIKTGDWTIADLVKYLVAVQQTLTSLELDRLRHTSAFPKEIHQDLPNAETERTKRYKASDLYEPLDVFKELKLPVIDWGTQTKWRASSEEAKFLFKLGLRRQPPMKDLLTLAAGEDGVTRNNAMRYFLDNQQKYPDYDPRDFNSLAYIPALTTNGKPTLGTPEQVFIQKEAALFGFLVVDSSALPDGAAEKLKLKSQPPTTSMVQVLEKSPPTNPSTARQWFEVLAGRITDFSPSQLVKLSQLKMVPYEQPSAMDTTLKSDSMLAPKDCYFRRDASQSFHSKLFVFIDFGTKANAFLSACGTKHEPSVEEIVQILLTDPKKFYRLSGGKDNYLVELRNIAINRRLVSQGGMMRLKRSPTLLGSRRVRRVKEKIDKIEALTNVNELDEDEYDFQYDLLKPDQVVIADDSNAYQHFGDSVFTAPQEDLLEDFYSELGSPRLSSLIREDYKTSAEIRDSKLSKEIRTLILERLPLFLHEHTHARPRIQYNWLNNEKNFVVRTYGKLTVTKNLNFGATRLFRSQDASAAAKRNAYGGSIELWLAGNAQVDMYEVAISLCRVLFEVPKANDALLFMTILSTDLRALRRRGYNVDRILRKQREDREAAEKEHRQQVKEMEKLLSDAQPDVPTHPPPAIAGSSATPLPVTNTGRDLPAPPSIDSPEPNISVGQRPTSSLVNQLQSWKRRLAPGKGEPSRATAPDTTASPSRPGSPSEQSQTPSRPHSPFMPGGLPGQSNFGVIDEDPITRRPRSPKGHVTSLNNIESNVKQAIAACREEHGNVLQNRQQMQTVRESLDEGYCDISGRVSDLNYIGSMSDVKVFVAKEVPNGGTILQEKHDAIARFIHVIRPLRTLYKLPPTSVNIFFDLQGDSIAFNRNASIFLNLRYYESWHDQDVQRRDLQRALTSWFFTLAHEIAHNLVQPHNSEHEFYFSSICESHVKHLANLLVGISS